MTDRSNLLYNVPPSTATNPIEPTIPEKNKVGRPTLCTEEVIKKTRHYIDDPNNFGDLIPTIEGLSDILDVSRKTLYLWEEKEENQEFIHILDKLRARQARGLINGGLSGELNSTITKMMLTKHGYHEKVEQEHTGPGGGAIENKLIIEFVGPANK